MTTGESVIPTEAAASSASEPMTSGNSSPGNGPITKSGRPSAIFYPDKFKNGAAAVKDAAKAGAAAWEVKTAPPAPR